MPRVRRFWHFTVREDQTIIPAARDCRFHVHFIRLNSKFSILSSSPIFNLLSPLVTFSSLYHVLRLVILKYCLLPSNFFCFLACSFKIFWNKPKSTHFPQIKYDLNGSSCSEITSCFRLIKCVPIIMALNFPKLTIVCVHGLQVFPNETIKLSRVTSTWLCSSCGTLQNLQHFSFPIFSRIRGCVVQKVFQVFYWLAEFLLLLKREWRDLDAWMWMWE